MKKNEPKIAIENNVIFLSLDLKGLNLYQRGKAIRKFINSDTKIVEDYSDTLIRAIFKRNGINIPNTTKQAYIEAFDSLKAKNKDIQVIDFYKDTKMDNCEYLSTSNNSMTILLEDNRYLICGVEVREVELNG